MTEPYFKVTLSGSGITNGVAFDEQTVIEYRREWGWQRWLRERRGKPRPIKSVHVYRKTLEPNRTLTLTVDGVKVIEQKVPDVHA